MLLQRFHGARASWILVTHVWCGHGLWGFVSWGCARVEGRAGYVGDGMIVLKWWDVGRGIG
jgi:hypothetical protein